MATQKFFTKLISPLKAPELLFEISPIQEDNFSEAAEVLTQVYSKHPLTIKLGFSYSSLHDDIMLPLVERAMNNNTGIVCFEIEEADLVGAMIWDDLSIIYKELPTKYRNFSRWSELEALLKGKTDLIESIIKQQNTSYLMSAMGVLPHYRNLGIGANMLYTCVKEHPILKEAEHHFFHPLAKRDLKMGENVGFEIFESKDWKDLEEADEYAKWVKDLAKYKSEETLYKMCLMWNKKKNQEK